MPKIYSLLDLLSGILLLITVALAPWLLGATTAEGVRILSMAGLVLGTLWYLKLVFLLFRGFEPDAYAKSTGSNVPLYLVAIGGLVILGYVLISALNPRASLQYTYFPGSNQATGVEIEYFNPIGWLPQSYDRGRTINAFWKYFALFLSFWAARDWLLGASRQNWHDNKSMPQFPTNRIETFLWTLSISAAALSLVGIIQRLDGTEKLLWLFVNHINGGHGAFGPFPYQSNGAQYLNLIWPVVLAFWWVLRRRNLARRKPGQRSGGDPHVMLMFFTVLIAAGTVVTRSRGGFLVLIALLMGALVVVTARARRQWGFKAAVLACFISILGLGGWLGGKNLWDRFTREDLGSMSGRKLIYEDAGKMAKDFAVFGSGAETFAPLYYFYRLKNPNWDAYVHDDYLETRITFGWVGFGIILLIFFGISSVPFLGTGLPAPPEFIVLLGLAMAGIMVHAKGDLPFQIYSIHFEFVMLCALLTCLKWEKR